MSVKSRIEQAWACEVINLSKSEENYYSGCGWKLAHFVDDKLLGFFDPLHGACQKNVRAMVDEAVERATRWMGTVDGEVWLVMCSCLQLCEPKRIRLDDASAIARMAWAFGEQFWVVTALRQ